MSASRLPRSTESLPCLSGVSLSDGDEESCCSDDGPKEMSAWMRADRGPARWHTTAVQLALLKTKNLASALGNRWDKARNTEIRLGLPLLALSLMVSTTLLVLLAVILPSVTKKPLPHCGGSVEEARDELHCVFDVMSNAWTPRECYFEDLALDFLDLPNTTWYADAEHTELVPVEEFSRGERPIVYPGWRHHDRHCLYTWRKMERAVSARLMLDSDSVAGAHVKHCTDYLVGRHPEVKPTLSVRGFLRCVEL